MLNHTHDADYSALWGQVNLCLECNNIQHPKYFSYSFSLNVYSDVLVISDTV